MRRATSTPGVARPLSIAEACHGVADWSDGFASAAAGLVIPPVLRIGVIAWLARVALRPAGDVS